MSQPPAKSNCFWSEFQLRKTQNNKKPRMGMATNDICLLIFFISLNSTAPMKRPINMPPQNSDTYLLASTVVSPATLGWPRKLMMVLPMETSPPTYMKIASTPSWTCGYFNAPKPRSTLPSPTCGRRMQKKTTAKIIKTIQNARYGTLTESAPCAPVLAKY